MKMEWILIVLLSCIEPNLAQTFNGACSSDQLQLADGCYEAFPGNLTHQEAGEACEAKSGLLALLKGPIQFQNLKKYLMLKDFKYTWITADATSLRLLRKYISSSGDWYCRIGHMFKGELKWTYADCDYLKQYTICLDVPTSLAYKFKGVLTDEQQRTYGYGFTTYRKCVNHGYMLLLIDEMHPVSTVISLYYEIVSRECTGKAYHEFCLQTLDDVYISSIAEYKCSTNGGTLLMSKNDSGLVDLFVEICRNSTMLGSDFTSCLTGIRKSFSTSEWFYSDGISAAGNAELEIAIQGELGNRSSVADFDQCLGYNGDLKQWMIVDCNEKHIIICQREHPGIWLSYIYRTTFLTRNPLAGPSNAVLTFVNKDLCTVIFSKWMYTDCNDAAVDSYICEFSGTCLASQLNVSDGCYEAFSDIVTYHQAVKLCVAKGGILALLKDLKQFESLKQYLKLKGFKFTWIASNEIASLKLSKFYDLTSRYKCAIGYIVNGEMIWSWADCDSEAPITLCLNIPASFSDYFRGILTDEQQRTYGYSLGKAYSNGYYKCKNLMSSMTIISESRTVSTIIDLCYQIVSRECTGKAYQAYCLQTLDEVYASSTAEYNCSANKGTLLMSKNNIGLVDLFVETCRNSTILLSNSTSCLTGIRRSSSTSQWLYPDETSAAQNIELEIALQRELSNGTPVADYNDQCLGYNGGLDQWMIVDCNEKHIIICQTEFPGLWMTTVEIAVYMRYNNDVEPSNTQITFRNKFLCPQISSSSWSYVHCDHPLADSYICKVPAQKKYCSKDEYQIGELCYQVVQGLTTFNQAENLCKERNGHLAILRDMTTLSHLQKIAIAEYVQTAWIGMYYDDSDVLTSVYGKYDGKYISQEHGLHNIVNSARCYYLRHQQQNASQVILDLIDCNDQLYNFFCERSGYSCPNLYKMDHVNRKCYRVGKTSISILEAERMCAVQSSKLAVLDESTIVFLQNNIQIRANTWIGLKIFYHNNMVHGRFSDSTPLTNEFSKWYAHPQDSTSKISSQNVYIKNPNQWYWNNISTAAALCQYEDLCPPKYVLYENSCYRSHKNVLLTMVDAEVLCAMDGGRLMKVDSGSFQERFVAYFLEENKIWSGFSRESTSDPWVSSDGLLLDAEIHVSSSGIIEGRQCAVLQFTDDDATYFSSACDDKHMSLCQIDLSKKCPTGMIPRGTSCILVAPILNVTAAKLSTSQDICSQMELDVLRVDQASDELFLQALFSYHKMSSLLKADGQTLDIGTCDSSSTICSYQSSVLCFIKDAICPLNYDFINTTSRQTCLKLISNSYTKTEADDNCHGHLADPINFEMMLAYSNLSIKFPFKGDSTFYFGITSSSTSKGFWRFSDDSVALQAAWIKGEPANPDSFNQNFCSTVNVTNSLLSTSNCEIKRKSICEVPVKTPCPQYMVTSVSKCNLGFENISSTCLPTRSILIVNNEDNTTSRRIYWSPDYLTDDFCYRYDENIHKTVLCPVEAGFVCRFKDFVAPENYRYFDGQFINISSNAQDFYSSFASCSRNDSVLFYEDHEAIHHVLRQILNKLSINSYWTEIPFNVNNTLVTSSGNLATNQVNSEYDLNVQICKIYYVDSTTKTKWMKKDVSCYESHHVVCVYKGGMCPSNFQYIDGECYHLYPKSVKMSEADATCAALSSKLVEIKQESPFKHLSKLLEIYNSSNVWTDVRAHNVNGKVNWTNSYGEQLLSLIEDDNSGYCSIFDGRDIIKSVSCFEDNQPLCVRKIEPDCPENYVFYLGQCLLVSNNTLSYLEGFYECQERNMSLLSITDEQLYGFIHHYIAILNISQIWLSSRYHSDLHQWIDATGASTFSKLEMSNFNATSYRLCFYISAKHEFQWMPGECDLEKTAVCQLPGCDGSARCYELIKNVTYDSAVSGCLNKKKTLVSIHDQSTQSIVETLIATDETAWIGLTRSPSMHIEFKFEDGNMLTHGYQSSMGRTHALLTCVVLTSDGMWEPQSCSSTNHFICQEANSLMTTSTTSSISTTPTTTTTASTTLPTTTIIASTTPTSTTTASTTPTSTTTASTTPTSTTTASTTPTSTTTASTTPTSTTAISTTPTTTVTSTEGILLKIHYVFHVSLSQFAPFFIRVNH